MNPFNRQSIMTPAAYLFLLCIVSVPFSHMYPHGDIVSYTLFFLSFVVAFLWNNLYLWVDNDE